MPSCGDRAATLTIIQSSHASMEGLETSGLLDRHRCLLAEYAKSFRVVVYSCDRTDYSSRLGIEHHPIPWLPRSFGWRHIVFYLSLVYRAPRMKGVVKVFGSNIPTLPLVRLLSGRPMMVSYQWNYAQGTYRNERMALKRWLASILEWLALARADLVLATTDRLDCYIRRTYDKPTVTLPNWVDLEQVGLSGKGRTRDRNMVLFAGRLTWIKGVDVLIDAFSYVKQLHPAAHLIVCGEGEEAPLLLSQINGLGLTGICFTGRVCHSEVLSLMHTAAVFVLPTITMEGHPKALIEAMACGAACVATDVPGNNDVILPAVTGLLVPPGDPRRLGIAISQILGDSDLRDRLGRAAREASRALDFRRVVQTEVHVLTEMVDARR